jgi:hypothetical protein
MISEQLEGFCEKLKPKRLEKERSRGNGEGIGVERGKKREGALR